MSWLQWLQTESAIPPVQAGLPRRVLRHIIVSNDVGVGSRVLDVGCGNGNLVRFLDELGIKASGIAKTTADLNLARTSAPGLDIFRSDELAQLSEDGRSFDLVIVRDSLSHGANLFSAEAFSHTASLIEVLRPAGSLVFVQEPGAETGNRAMHAASCFSRHLCVFPGSCKTAEFPVGSGQIEVLRRVFATPAGDQFVTATYCRPIESSTHYEWQAIARVAAASHRDKCCSGLGSHSALHHRRAA